MQFLITWIGNSVTFISIAECIYRDSLTVWMLRLIAIIVAMFYGPYAKC
jgi:hypothetical protein